MPIFELETPDGVFEVEAPDEQTALAALSNPQQDAANPYGGPVGVAAGAPAEIPEGRSIGTRIDDIVRGAADTASFGFSDEMAAGAGALTGLGGQRGDYAGNVARERARDSAGGWERLGGQVLGALASPAGAAKTVLGAAAQGAGLGALYGLGSGEGSVTERLPSAAIGGVTGGAAGGLVRAGANALQSRAVRKMIPSNEQLQQWKTAAYKASESAGDILPKPETQTLARNVVSDLTEHGFDPANEPGVMAVLKRIQNAENENVTLKGLETMRKVASNGYIPGNKSNNALIGKIIDRIDEATEGMAGSPALKQGRDYARRQIRSEGLDKTTAQAEMRAAVTGSGGNVDNLTRQRVEKMLLKPRGMKPAEKKAAERVVFGTGPQNFLRRVGKLSPQGNGLMTALGVGGAMVNPFLGIPAVVATGAKSLADRATVKNVEKLSEVIRSGGYSAADITKLARSGKLPLKAVKAIEAAEKQFRNRAAVIAAMYADKMQN